MTDPSYMEKFHRNVGIVTEPEQQKLRNTTVAIAGAGGVGGNVAHILARSGVGGFKIADHDVFSPSNVSRQYGATMETLGHSKVDVVTARIRAINQEASVVTFPDGLTTDNIGDFLDGADAVVDVIDFLYPDIRNRLVGAAQDRGLYTFQPATLGFSANLLVFAPDGPTCEDVFGPAPDKVTPLYRIRFGRKAFPVVPKYVNKLAYLKGLSASHHIPTFCPLVMLASTITATDVILHVLGKRDPVCIPKLKWIDLLEHKFEILETKLRSKRRKSRKAA
jgi:molybdopterin/thiamine biosynthesis adenylyltransferase